MPMPQTEQIELRTDTVEEIIDRLDYDIVGRRKPMSRARRESVKDRLRDQISKPDGIALCGLPGAGKSYAAGKMSTVYDAPVVGMGDAIREQYSEQHGVEPSGGWDSEDLGNFAAQWREDDPEAIPEKVTEIADRYYQGVGRYEPEQSDLIIIDGVRSPTDAEVLGDYFENFYLIEVKADFYTRLDRLQERGREGEGDFDAVDLAERDINERRNLGFKATKEGDYIDISMKNGTGPDKLAIRLSDIVENNLPFEIADGRPLGLDDELEKFRREVM